MKNARKQIKRLKYNLSILDKKGNNIRTLGGFKSKEEAKILGSKLYTVLVKKLKQKVRLSVKPDIKKQAFNA